MSLLRQLHATANVHNLTTLLSFLLEDFWTGPPANQCCNATSGKQWQSGATATHKDPTRLLQLCEMSHAETPGTCWLPISAAVKCKTGATTSQCCNRWQDCKPLGNGLNQCCSKSEALLYSLQSA